MDMNQLGDNNSKIGLLIRHEWIPYNVNTLLECSESLRYKILHDGLIQLLSAVEYNKIFFLHIDSIPLTDLRGVIIYLERTNKVFLESVRQSKINGGPSMNDLRRRGIEYFLYESDCTEQDYIILIRSLGSSILFCRSKMGKLNETELGIIRKLVAIIVNLISVLSEKSSSEDACKAIGRSILAFSEVDPEDIFGFQNRFRHQAKGNMQIITLLNITSWKETLNKWLNDLKGEMEGYGQ